jgi:ComF family protein
MLHGFKYSNQIFLSVELGALLAGCVQAHYGDIDFDAVVSVPLHRRKWRERSYNQAEVLARELARTRKIDLIKNALCRNRFTPSQTNLSASERLLNVRNAFVVLQPDWISERRILLVDDVMTTGATVNECAKVLMQAGAVSVHVATVARG